MDCDGGVGSAVSHGALVGIVTGVRGFVGPKFGFAVVAAEGDFVVAGTPGAFVVGALPLVGDGVESEAVGGRVGDLVGGEDVGEAVGAPSQQPFLGEVKRNEVK